MTGSSPFRHRLSNILKRDPQLIGTFEARDPHSGYYNDLRSKAIELGSRADASAALRSMTADRRLANAVSVAQLGLGAWQLSADEPEWLPVVAEASEWIAAQLDGDGLFAYRFAMPHTYDLEPPWYSAMAQGEAASLLVRASRSLGRVEFLAAAARAIGSLLDDRSGLVAETAEGPVLQEYPTRPPAHALNGWIFALWGLYDVGLVVSPNSDGSSTQLAPEAEKAFKHGSDALSGRLRHYDAGLNWSRYDLFPHRIAHAASPFYHRLHIEQLKAMARLCPEHKVFEEVAKRWESGAHSPFSLGYGVSKKIAFRVLEPRRPAS